MTDKPSAPDVEGSGRVRVETLSGTRYEIDLIQMEMRRTPAHDRSSAPGDLVSADLRRDNDVIHIREILRFEVGSRGEFILEPLGNPEIVAFTHRSTTPIISIEAVIETESDPGE